MDVSINMMLRQIALIEQAIGWGILLIAFFRARPWTQFQSRESQSSSSAWGGILILIGLAFLLVPYSPTDFQPSLLMLEISIALCPIPIFIALAALVSTRKKRWLPADGTRPRLPRTGIYRAVRHPVYTALLALAASTAIGRTWWPMMVPGFFFLILGIEFRSTADDLGLANVFQDEFFEHQAQTRSYLPLIR
jgi:protein-S-isoprenylcysteine O-methyltransferase Ste14